MEKHPQKNIRQEKPSTWAQRRGEITGILWMAAGLLFLSSLVSYHPDDPSINAVSSDPQIWNFIGRMGAALSDVLFLLFGAGAYLLPLSALLLGWGKIRNRKGISPARFLGFLGLLLFLPAYFQLYFTRLPLSIYGVVPAGGLTGDLLSVLMLKYFAPLGSTLITLTSILLSVILFTGVSPVQAVKKGVLVLNGIRAASTGNRNRRPGATQERPLPESGTAEADLPGTVTGDGLKKVSAPPKIAEKPQAPRIPPLQEEFEFARTIDEGTYRLPSLSLLDDLPKAFRQANRDELLMSSQILEKKLRDFGVLGQVVQLHPGPVITLYEFEPAPGIKLNQIVNLSDDLALAMKSGSVRIVAPIPGKSTVGLEVPNRQREEVRLKEVLASEPFTASRSPLNLALGRDIFGTPVVADLMRMPHLLVAGATGSGKSVALNAMISSLLFRAAPSEVRMIMIDPKMIELSAYDGIPHLLCPVVTHPKEAAWALQKVVAEMQRRYQLLSEKGHRNVESYHRALAAEKKGGEAAEEPVDPVPFIVVIIDELADLMMVASREVEDSIARLAQMARAAGIHLIVATQRPSVDVLTGVIKANFPTRISFQVSSKTDSRTILDANGAEELLGKGDMLYLPSGSGRLTRVHGAYISEGEIKRLLDFIREQVPTAYDPAFEPPAQEEALSSEFQEDEFYRQAKDLVLSTGQASISLIQRRLRIGFNRAARMIERMEREGIVGPSNSGKREVFKKKAFDI
jgi:S-DNA-T family DNA segregation ATPase FtsK/SpoIIIE